MLVDFNLAMDSQFKENSMAGGTIPYMSPESVMAFASKEDSGADCEFDADVYALGVMLWELASGRLPFASFGAEVLYDPEELALVRASRKAEPEQDQPIDPLLVPVLKRAFHFDPKFRFQSASEFGETLQGVSKQACVIKKRASDGWLGRTAVKRPILWLAIATFLPHIVASVLQIAYNQAEIVSRLTVPATEVFYWLIRWANPVIYGICGIFVVKILQRVFKPWFAMKRGQTVAEEEMELIRKDLLLVPRKLAVVGAIGWLVGAVVFPGIIYLLHPEKFTLEIWMHFVCSFAISCAIAVTFSYALSLAVVVYALYPTYFSTPFRFSEKAAKQLGPIRANWASLANIAGMIPLAAAILVVTFFEPDEFREVSGRELAFKSLVIGLILASVVGFALVRYNARAVSRLIDECIRSDNDD